VARRVLPMPLAIMPAEPGPSLQARELPVVAPAVASTCGDTTSPAATLTLKAGLRPMLASMKPARAARPS
jgi:hypothetical protein